MEALCVCLTGGVETLGRGEDPWLSDVNPLDPAQRSKLDRVVALYPGLAFIIQFYAFVPQLATEGN